jgi:transcriptional regulator with XRE-family HTH domain
MIAAYLRPGPLIGGTTLRRLRLAARLTQRDLAWRIGVAQPRIALWEAGDGVPARHQVAVLRELADALERADVLLEALVILAQHARSARLDD